MNKDYWQGWKDGKKSAVNEFARRFEKLQHEKGIGPKTIKKMVRIMELPIDK